MLGLKGMLIVGGIAAVAISGLLVRDHFQTARLNALKKDYAAESAAHDTTKGQLKVERDNAVKARKASNDYQTELEALRAAAAVGPRVVRVCLGTAANVPTAASGPATAGSEGLQDPTRPDTGISRDIGPELYALADEADRCAVQRDALIRYVTQ